MRSLTAIIPSNGSLKSLKITLKGLLNSKRPNDFEIIVINDANSRTLHKFIEKVQTFTQLNFKEIRNKNNLGPGKSRNQGIKAASNEWLLFVDDEMNLPNNWWEVILSYSCNASYIATNIQVRKKDSETLAEKFFRINDFNAKEKYEKQSFGLTGFLCVEKALFMDVGMFNEDLFSGEDFEFSQRVRNTEKKQVFIYDLIVKHEPKGWYEQFKRKKRILLGHRDLASLNYDQFYYLKLKPIDVFKTIKYMFVDLLLFKKTKLYQSGEVNFFQHELAQFIYYTLHLSAQVLVLTLPKKAFNW